MFSSYSPLCRLMFIMNYYWISSDCFHPFIKIMWSFSINLLKWWVILMEFLMSLEFQVLSQVTHNVSIPLYTARFGMPAFFPGWLHLCLNIRLFYNFSLTFGIKVLLTSNLWRILSPPPPFSGRLWERMVEFAIETIWAWNILYEGKVLLLIHLHELCHF